MHDAHAQVGVRLDEERAPTIERLILIERTKSEHLHTRLVCIQNGSFDVTVDARPLALEEELDGKRRCDPRLNIQMAQAVLVGNKHTANEPQHQQHGQRQGPHTIHEPVRLERMCGKGARHKGQVEHGKELRAVRQKHCVGSFVRHSHASAGLLEERPRVGVERAVHPVIERHEKTEIGVHLRVVEWVEGGCVDEVLEARDVFEGPDGKELKVAVAQDVEEIKAQHVNVEHSNRRASRHPRPNERYRKVDGIHEVLHERVNRPCDGLWYERSVVVRVVVGIQRVQMQCSVQPIISELGGPHVQEQHLNQPLAVEESANMQYLDCQKHVRVCV